mgnify:CR=1 FL=1
MRVMVILFLVISNMILYIYPFEVTSYELGMQNNAHTHNLPYSSTSLDTSTLEYDPNYSDFPFSSFLNFSNRLHVPAGKHGFLTVNRSDGHFYFEDGTRIRFWGVNIAGLSSMQNHSISDQMAEALSQAGVNMVRLHAIDPEYPFGGLINYSYNDSQHFNDTNLDNFDYFISKMKSKGIYVWLVLYHLRIYYPNDGLENTSELANYTYSYGNPIIIYNRTMIELQKKFMFELLYNHTNPYTGLNYSSDPAIAAYEIFNENGLFWNINRLKSMPEPYQEELNISWNRWLKNHYNNTTNLDENWTNYLGQKALQPGESIENENIYLPQFYWKNPWDLVYTDRNNSSARRNDMYQFLYELENNYFIEMKEHLKNNLSVRSTITAINGYWHTPALKVLKDNLDFIDAHQYRDDGPFWLSGDTVWQFPFHFKNNTIVKRANRECFPCGFLKVSGMPTIVGEWGFQWPVDYRSDGMLLGALYGRLHDLDGMVYYNYHQPSEDQNNTIDFKRLDIWNMHTDPTRWGLFALAGKIFLDNDFEVSKLFVERNGSYVDTFYNAKYPYLRLGWNLPLNNTFYDQNFSPYYSLKTPFGKSANSTGFDNRSLIFSRNSAKDLYDKTYINDIDSLNGYNVQSSGTGNYNFIFDGIMYPVSTIKTLSANPGFNLTNIIASGYTPVGRNTTSNIGYGFYDLSKNNFVFKDNAEPDRVILDALNIIYGTPTNNSNITDGIFTAVTNQIKIDSLKGLLTGCTNRTMIVNGYLRDNGLQQCNVAQFKSDNFYGTFIATTSDEQSLNTSRNYSFKLVTVAHNTGENFSYNATASAITGENIWDLTDIGWAPVLTFGAPSQNATNITLNNETIFSIYMVNGTWELLRESYNFTLFSDTPNINMSIYPDTTTNVSIQKFYRNGTIEEIISLNNFTYPSDVKFIKVTLLPDIEVSNGSYTLSGSNYIFNATLTNKGKGISFNTTITFYNGDPNSGGILIGTPKYVSNLYPGEQINVSSDLWTPPGSGDYTIFVTVNNSNPPDGDLNNNVTTIFLVGVFEFGGSVIMVLLFALSVVLLIRTRRDSNPGQGLRRPL